MAPTDPDMIYAIVEAAEKKGGIFRSPDRGVTWEKRNDFDQQAQYYSHIVVDPVNKDRLYVMNVWIRVSDDGGKTLHRLGEKWKHVDSHTIWIDPKDPKYYLVGCDGGIYESFDRAANWHFKSNLPVTQFYDVTCDQSGPFYHVYGGTQDNYTLGGPAHTRSDHGVTNADWFVVQDGDGFHCKVDPANPNIVYGEAQYGILVRFDRRTGQRVGIQPQPGAGEPPLRWNWDSPLIISPHSPTRIYFAANRIFRSDDRGDSWKPISPDLTREIDRDKLPVMGKIWGPDAVAKHLSTSFYGNIVALAESPRKDGLLYAGTDDGLIQVTEDGGKTWRKIDKFSGVPEGTYVSRIIASPHAVGTVYASFDNHKNGDFLPYLLRSTDAGKTWASVAGDLPGRGSVNAIAEDFQNPDLLFVGTEFALYVTLDGGKKWHRLKTGLPTISVKDLAIQHGMNDLVVGTFGRGFYVLDDYSVLRSLKPETLAQDATLFPVRDAVLYVPTQQYGLRGKAFLGESFYTADNPPFGATFTYHLKEPIRTRKEIRQEAEKEAIRKGEMPRFPTKDELREEAEEEPPVVLLTVQDADGRAIRMLTGPVKVGIQRVAWDLRDPAAQLLKPPKMEAAEDDPFVDPPAGPLVLPGRYRVSLARRVRGQVTPLAGPVEFSVVPDGLDAVSGADRKELAMFQREVARLQRAALGALETAKELDAKLEDAKRALDQVPAADAKARDLVRSLIARNREILRALRGDTALRSRNENTPVSIAERVDYIIEAQRHTLSKPTATEREAYRIAGAELAAETAKLKAMIETDLKALEKAMDAAGAPWTPGRLLEWKEK
jgi:photosystem II stability/assembly factor-like uncharacterized protein